MKNITPISVFLVVLLAGCHLMPNTRPTEDKTVANVGSHYLYLSDINELVSPTTATPDSQAIVNGYIDQWVRKMVVITEAEEKLSSTIDIDRLVENYRSSLILSNYRQQYVKANLDTTLQEADVAKEYKEQSDNYILAEDIVIMHVAKVESKKTGMDAFYKDWLRGNSAKVLDYCEAHAESYHLDDEWLTTADALMMLPSEKFKTSDLTKKGSLQKYYDGYEYFVKVNEVVDKGELPPLSYVQDKLKEVIIQKRKKDLLEKLEVDLYTQALASKKVKIFKK